MEDTCEQYTEQTSWDNAETESPLESAYAEYCEQITVLPTDQESMHSFIHSGQQQQQSSEEPGGSPIRTEDDRDDLSFQRLNAIYRKKEHKAEMEKVAMETKFAQLEHDLKMEILMEKREVFRLKKELLMIKIIKEKKQ